ncbi:hypothetical protein JZ785_19655 [Alicyclobacillus curvatus]|nr:hypothetical protein JZ785_19655 [Alicyclobacillus curvatus]
MTKSLPDETTSRRQKLNNRNPLAFWKKIAAWRKKASRKQLAGWEPVATWKHLAGWKHLATWKHLAGQKHIATWKHLAGRKHIANWKEIVKFTAVPLLTVVITVVAWAVMPKPEIPEGFRSIPDGLRLTDHTPPGLDAPDTGDSGGSGGSYGASGSSGASGAWTGSSGSSAASGLTGISGPAASSTVPGASAAEGVPAPTSGGSPGGSPVAAASPSVARARTNRTLVSIGDSITFGFGLPGAVPGHPSPYAYPYLVGRAEDMNVTDLGVTGWSSADLLNALQTKKFQTALRRANLVTIDIGSNDLLHASYKLLAPNAILPRKNAILDSAIFQQAMAGYVERLPQIVHDVQNQTTAPIVLVNLYDPFPDGSALHDLAEQLIAAANSAIWKVAAENQIPVVNAYQVMNHHQATNVRLNELDIHPTPIGQQQLAKAVEQAVGAPGWYVPAMYAVSDGGTLVYEGAAASSSPIGWIRGNAGVRVTGRRGAVLQVLLPSGQTGYVDMQNVTLLVRPFANRPPANPAQLNGSHTRAAGANGAQARAAQVDGAQANTAQENAPWADGAQFQQQTATVKSGTVSVYLPSESAVSGEGFVWNKTVYVPLDALASAARSKVTKDGSTRTIELMTPLHSGLIQGSWALAGSSGSTGSTGSSGSASTHSNPTQSLVYSPADLPVSSSANSPADLRLGSSANSSAGKTQTATLVLSGWLLQIDGEDVNLGAPIVSENGVLYIPASAAWREMGGTVTRGTNGLLTLSAGGS